MTATTSQTNKGFFGKRFRNDILGNKKLLIINFVLEILGLPVITLICIIFAGYSEKRQSNAISEWVTVYALLTPFIMIGVGTIIISILLGLVISLFHFDYLYRKSVVDMNYSLPLSNTQRFFADYLSGLAVYLVPVIIAVILSFGILGVGAIFVDISEITPAIPHIIKAGLIVIVGMILIYTLSVFSIVFCGSTFEAIFGIFALNVMIPATIGCVWLAIISTSTFGMVGESIFNSTAFTSTSPIGAVVFFCLYLFDGIDGALAGGTSQYYDHLYIRWMAATLIMCLIYLAASYLLYRFRKAEDVSKPYVYKAFFYAVMTMAVFCIMSLFISNDINVIPGIVICAIGWFIMEVISRRGFKRFWTAPIGFTAAVLGVFLICGVCYATYGFGASKHVPASFNVESMTIGFSDSSLMSSYDIDSVVFKDKDVIKAATALNKDVVDRHFNYDDYSYKTIASVNDNTDVYDAIGIELNYYTIYGSSIQREYSVNSGMLDELVTAMLLSDEYAEFVSSQAALDVYNNADNVYYPNIGSAERAKKGGKLEVYNKLIVHESTVSLGYDSVRELRKAYYQDMKNMTEDELKNEKVYCYLGTEYWVLDSFENTKAFLSKYDISVEPINADTLASSTYNSITFRFVKNRTFYFEPERLFLDNSYYEAYSYYYNTDWDEDDTVYAAADSITSIYPYNRNSYDGQISYSMINEYDNLSSGLPELFDSATPIIIGEEPLAVVYIGGNALFIPDRGDNRELLKNKGYRTYSY